MRGACRVGGSIKVPRIAMADAPMAVVARRVLRRIRISEVAIAMVTIFCKTAEVVNSFHWRCLVGWSPLDDHILTINRKLSYLG